MAITLSAILISAGPGNNVATHVNAGYIIGIIVGFLILCYLFYSLIKPEKF